MSLYLWAKAGWLKPHRATAAEVAALFKVVDRDLEDSRQNISPDGRFHFAYHAALKLCTLALLADGWKSDGPHAQHRTIMALPLVIGKTWWEGADYLDACRDQHDALEHDKAGQVTVAETNALGNFATGLREVVAAWLGKRYPQLSPWRKPPGGPR